METAKATEGETEMADIKITIENANEYGKGTEVEFNFGAYYAPRSGIVTNVEVVAATKFFPAFARLTAEYQDEDGETVSTTITHFSDRGVGTRLVKAKATEAKQSKWAA